MGNRNAFHALLIGVLVLCGVAAGQTAQSATQNGGDKAAQNRVLGEVTAINPAQMQIDLRTSEGRSVVVKLDGKTLYRRVPPGETTLAKASVISLGDISVGDRVIARGERGEGEGSLRAGALIVVSKAEMAKKLELDRAEWLKRGIAGVVTAVNAQTHEVTVLTRGHEESKSVVVAAGQDAALRRYAPDSVKFADARPSTFEELKVGDQLRALGEKSADGARFTAEEIISGSFRTITGKVTAVNPSNNEIQVADVQSRQPVTIAVSADSQLRRLSPAVIELIKQSVAGSSSKSKDAPSGGDIQDKIEQLPAFAVADLKVGDSVLVSSTSGSAPGRVTAIIVAAGAESLLQWQAQQSTKRVFNFGLGLPSGSPID